MPRGVRRILRAPTRWVFYEGGFGEGKSHFSRPIYLVAVESGHTGRVSLQTASGSNVEEAAGVASA